MELANRDSRKNGITESYYGSLTYKSLKSEQFSRKQYAEKYMEVKAKKFQKCVVELEGKVSDSKGQEYFVRVLSAVYCTMRYIIVPRYPAKTKEEAERGKITL